MIINIELDNFPFLLKGGFIEKFFTLFKILNYLGFFYNLKLENKNKRTYSTAFLVFLVLSAYALIFASTNNIHTNLDFGKQNPNFDELLQNQPNRFSNISDTTNIFGSDTTRFDSLKTFNNTI